MSGNITLNSGSGGSVIRAIDKAGAHAQVLVLDIGGAGTEALLSATNPLPTASNMGATAVTTRIEAQDVLYTSFLIKASNANRKELIVLSHGSGNLHLCYFSPATYISPVELFEHDTWVEERYTGDVYGKFHIPAYGTETAVTFQDTGDTVTMLAHGRNNNEKVSFTSITSTTGITITTLYYVINETEDTFQLSLTSGGAAIALTTNGTGELHPLTGFVITTEVTT